MKKCIFCRVNGRSKEHIISSWIVNRIRQVHGEDYFKDNSRFIFGGNPHENDNFSKLIRKNWSGFVSYRMCKPCNTSWMKKNEDAVIPILRESIANEDDFSIILSNQSKIALAQWAWMKALSFAAMEPVENPYYYFPEEFYVGCKNGFYPSGLNFTSN